MGCLVAEFKEGCEAGDVVGRIDEWETEIESLDELKIRVTELKYVYLRDGER